MDDLNGGMGAAPGRRHAGAGGSVMSVKGAVVPVARLSFKPDAERGAASLPEAAEPAAASTRR
jgi:hypothetical protein